MGYRVAVERVAGHGTRHVYAYGREAALHGHLTLDTATGRIYASDEHGEAVAQAFVDVEGAFESRSELPVEEWWKFLEAAIGVMKGVQKHGRPPAVADRAFG